VEVREATASDWPAVATLLTELGRPDVRGTPEEEDARQLFHSYLKRADTAAFVADLDGEVVGFVNVEFRPRLNHQSKEGWIAELIVCSARRSAGVGKALLKAAEDKARSVECWGMALESATWRKGAHRFYEREGWTQSALAFTKLLDSSVPERGNEPR